MAAGRWLVAAWALFAAAGAQAERGDGAALVLAVANAESFDHSLPALRYAHEDAERFARVMERTGLVPADRIVVVKEASAAALRAAFAAAKGRFGQAPGTFIFYYTGHSDATGLHLADGVLRKAELLRLIGSVPATAHVAFFDGCYSGALAAKGVRPAADFAVPKAEFDQPTGSVFLAATSASDVAFEVEELKGSLFSHHVVDGLYGAADLNHDGLVTIDELYQHVYKEMQAHATGLPGAAAQTPEYRVDLAGRGALVLSYLDRSTVPVTIARDVAGEMSFAASDGLQVYRSDKAPGAPLRLLLVPGEYAVTVRDGERVGRGTLRLAAGGAAALGTQDLAFHTEKNLDLVAKGKRPEAQWGVAVGAVRGSFTKLGPSVELAAATPAARIETTAWRLAGLVGVRQNELFYRRADGVTQRGGSQTASILAAAAGAFARGGLVPGQEWQVLLGGGGDYARQTWSGPAARAFAPWMPKAAAGVGAAFTQGSGRAWGVSIRREFPFATERGTGDVLAFAATAVALTAAW